MKQQFILEQQTLCGERTIGIWFKVGNQSFRLNQCFTGSDRYEEANWYADMLIKALHNLGAEGTLVKVNVPLSKNSKKDRDLVRSQGICIHCFKRKITKQSKSFCNECLIANRERCRVWRDLHIQKLIDQGICRNCHKRKKSPRSKSRCEICLTRQREYAREHCRSRRVG